MSVADWVADKLSESKTLKIIDRKSENILVINSNGNYTFNVGVLGIKQVINRSDVEPLFAGSDKPQLVVNIPTSALWSGSAINLIHSASAAFGSYGDVLRAASNQNAGSYRDKNMGFFINAMSQHSNVVRVSYINDSVFLADRFTGTSLAVAVIDTYNMSAEDVREARHRLGNFDVIVKASSHGSITSHAEAAAKSMGAEALTFRELMGRLAH